MSETVVLVVVVMVPSEVNVISILDLTTDHPTLLVSIIKHYSTIMKNIYSLKILKILIEITNLRKTNN